MTAITPENATRLATINRSAQLLQPLLDAGMNEDDATSLLCTRYDTGWDMAVLRSDADVYRACPDSALVLRLADAGVATSLLLAAGEGRLVLTATDLDTCLRHGVDPVLATGWIRRAPTGDTDPLEDLITALGTFPGVDPNILVSWLTFGATVDDIAWLIATGADVDGLDSIDDARASLAGITGACERRIALLLVAHRRTGTAYAFTVAAAAADTPWADLFVRLIVDDDTGFAPDVADVIRTARAEQRLHDQQQALRVTRATPDAGRTR